jgi:phosphoglycolate phosphatase-like HAD superfamily hydrolase
MKPTTLVEEVERLDLTRWFTSIITSPGNKTEAISKLCNVKAVVGDTEHDILPAKRLGILAIGVSTGIRSRDALERLNPDHVFDQLTGVLGVL